MGSTSVNHLPDDSGSMGGRDGQVLEFGAARWRTNKRSRFEEQNQRAMEIVDFKLQQGGKVGSSIAATSATLVFRDH